MLSTSIQALRMNVLGTEAQQNWVYTTTSHYIPLWKGWICVFSAWNFNLYTAKIIGANFNVWWASVPCTLRLVPNNVRENHFIAWNYRKAGRDWHTLDGNIFGIFVVVVVVVGRTGSVHLVLRWECLEWTSARGWNVKPNKATLASKDVQTTM